MPTEVLEGIVISAMSGRCNVQAGGQTWRCELRGRLKQGRKEVQALAVAGDRVRFDVLDAEADPPRGVIEEVLPRRNRISRQSARRSGGHIEQVLMANLDQVIAVQSLRDPEPQTAFVDRLMVAAEKFQVEGVLILNKTDLFPDGKPRPEDRLRWEYYQDLGYRVIWTSVESGLGLADFKAVLAGRISLLIGASGVGKSSLLNALEPGLGLRVNEVTGKTGLGKHTTTRTQLFPVADGGFIADSPGIRGFDPWSVDPLEAREYFPDFVEPGRDCRFRTCMHRDEPDCGVKSEVARGRIPRWRHEAYLALVRDLEERVEQRGY